MEFAFVCSCVKLTDLQLKTKRLIYIREYLMVTFGFSVFSVTPVSFIADKFMSYEKSKQLWHFHVIIYI